MISMAVTTQRHGYGSMTATTQLQEEMSQELIEGCECLLATFNQLHRYYAHAGLDRAPRMMTMTLTFAFFVLCLPRLLPCLAFCLVFLVFQSSFDNFGLFFLLHGLPMCKLERFLTTWDQAKSASARDHYEALGLVLNLQC